MPDKAKPSLIVSWAFIVTPIAAIVIFAFYREKHLVAVGAAIVLAFMIICQIASHYFYYRKHEPEIIEADEHAARGLWILSLIGFSPIVVLDIYQDELGIPDQLLEWSIFLPAVLIGGYLYSRTRKLRRKARQKIAERKAREAEAQARDS